MSSEHAVIGRLEELRAEAPRPSVDIGDVDDPFAEALEHLEGKRPPRPEPFDLPETPEVDPELLTETALEALEGLRREARPKALYGPEKPLQDVVELEDLPLSVADARAALNLPERARKPTTSGIPEPYDGFEDAEEAAALHHDYEHLLKDPDGGSVVARMIGVQALPQENQAAAITLAHPPEINPDMDPDLIRDRVALDVVDRNNLDAAAIAEGMLRGQAASAWTVPLAMVDEQDMPLRGIPWSAVTAAAFRSPQLGTRELMTTVEDLKQMPLPKGVDDWGEGTTLADHIGVIETPDGRPGVMFVKVDETMPTKTFQEVIRALRDRHENWQVYRGLQTEWGTHAGNVITADQYEQALERLPQVLRERVQSTVDRLGPSVKRLRAYHTSKRKAAKA